MAQNPELALWRAVLALALHDAARGDDPGWIGSRDFHMVCHLAGLDPQAVLRAYCPERFERRPTIAA